MVDRIRQIAVASLYNLSKTEDGGTDRTFSIHEIATYAAQMFSLDFDELSNSLGTYLAATVRSGRDHDFTGDPYHGFYMLTDAGQELHATIVAAAAVAVSHQERTTASKASSSSSSSSSRFIPGTRVRSAASARDEDDDAYDDDSGPDDSAVPAARDESANRNLSSSSSSSSSQRLENHPSAYSNMTGKRDRGQQSSSSSLSSSAAAAAAAAGSANGIRQSHPALSKPSTGINSRLF